VKLLLDSGADPNIATKAKRPTTPLLLACALGQKSSVEALLAADADVEATYSIPPEDEFNSLMVTIHSSEIMDLVTREAIAELLIEKGVNTLIPRADQCSPMVCALDKNMFRICDIMVDRGITRLDKIAVCLFFPLFLFLLFY